MSRLSTLWKLMLSMIKIGAFTFGGGYAMIGLLEQEFVTRREWIESEEFLDLVAIAESTPGPIAINCATYIGYKKAGIAGSVAATLGMCLPSFAIIYLVSLFFDQFLTVAWVAKAFRGIRICVVFLILSAGFRMFKKMKKGVFQVVLFSLTLGCTVVLSLFGIGFSSILYILLGGVAGVMVYAVNTIQESAKTDEKEGGT